MEEAARYLKKKFQVRIPEADKKVEMNLIDNNQLWMR